MFFFVNVKLRNKLKIVLIVILSVLSRPINRGSDLLGKIM